MLKVVDNPGVGALKGFVDRAFEHVHVGSMEEFSGKLIAAHESGENLAARVQDELVKSTHFSDLVNHDVWKELAADAYGCSVSDILVVFPHLRIDLPTRFKADEKKMSLPWHQEAGYYLERGNCSPDSIVMSTYLHDCSTEQGALVVASKTEKEALHHDREFMDPQNKRFMRV